MTHRSSPSLEPTKRFSDRVVFYHRYRPRYPDALIKLLSEIGMKNSSVVADVGSGTGILTEELLKHAGTVYAVEPNPAMRQFAENLLIGFPNFHSIGATAEATTLTDGSLDLITVAQTFHWLDPVAVKKEFHRILNSHGSVAIIYNMRQTDSSPFMRAYEQFLRKWSVDYQQVIELHPTDKVLQGFFGSYERREFPNEQFFDYQGLEGRVLSSSYIPMEGHQKYTAMLAALRMLFDEYQHDDGRVRFDYRTEVYHSSRFNA